VNNIEIEDIINRVKIVDKQNIKEVNESFGFLLRNIEYHVKNPSDDRITISQIFNEAISFRNKLNKI